MSEDARMAEGRDSAISIQNVSMMFNMSTEKVDGLKEYAIKLIKRQLRFKEFWALRDVSFEVRRGEVFGLLGLNGAGKSTLLKIVAGVFKATSGHVAVNGRIVPLIELGAGFDPDLSARENIFMNGSIFGFSPQYMEAECEKIIGFAELRDFEHVAVKNFSSGMMARLGFSIAVNVRPDILIIDEILSVGDFKFQEKSRRRVLELMAQSATVLMVSHSIAQIREMCTRAALLESGRLVAVGDAGEICDLYQQA